MLKRLEIQLAKQRQFTVYNSMHKPFSCNKNWYTMALIYCTKLQCVFWYKSNVLFRWSEHPPPPKNRKWRGDYPLCVTYGNLVTSQQEQCNQTILYLLCFGDMDFKQLSFNFAEMSGIEISCIDWPFLELLWDWQLFFSFVKE